MVVFLASVRRLAGSIFGASSIAILSTAETPRRRDERRGKGSKMKLGDQQSFSWCCSPRLRNCQFATGCSGTTKNPAAASYEKMMQDAIPGPRTPGLQLAGE